MKSSLIHLSILILLLVLGTARLQAQEIPPKTEKAISLFKDGKLIEAKDQILEALKDPSEASHEYSW